MIVYNMYMYILISIGYGRDHKMICSFPMTCILHCVLNLLLMCIMSCIIEAIEIKGSGCSTNCKTSPTIKGIVLAHKYSYCRVWCAASSLRSICTVLLVLSQYYTIHYYMHCWRVGECVRKLEALTCILLRYVQCPLHTLHKYML